jgi:enediyne biosynthesis protein E4
MGQEPATTMVKMTNVTASSGIQFIHTHGGGGEGYIIEGMSAGIATFDYDNDGLIDIYFLNGTPLKGTKADKPARNALYRNNGDWTFTDVTAEAGVGGAGYSLGVAVADYDGDGDRDIYVNCFGPNVLYRNNGNKTFTDVTEEAGVGNGNKVGAGVGFLDIEGDGDLDLYVANYVNFNYDNHIPIVINGKRYQAGPQYYKPVSDTLYRNLGNGKFEDISLESGIASVAGPSMGLVCADFDNDEDVDIFVANDGQPNFLFQNDGKGHFEEVGLLAGVACDFNGKANSNMGVDVGDYDNDGLLDLFTTTYQAEMPVLYHNLGDGFFEDATSSARITYDLFPHVNWGCSFSDFDNDGDQDLYLACGHFDRIEQIDDRTSQKIRNYLLLNQAGKFTDISARCGDGLAIVESSRAAAFDDLDNDGDIDIVVLNSEAAPTIIRNDSLKSNHWITLSLKQPGPNPDAVGARVTLKYAKGYQVAEVLSGRGYQSYFGSRLHFGLADTEGPVTVEIRWPNRGKSTHELEVDKIHVIEMP